MPRKVVIVDLFAGGGGASNGVKSAVRLRDVVIEQFVAVNHWKAAIVTHEANHPDATHYHCAVEEVDPRKAIKGNRVDLLVAGPSCTTHSNAKGGQSRDEQSRTSPWSILNWVKDLWVRALIIENVPEFQKWGPLDSNGKPIKRLEGTIFREFIRALESHNYNVEFRVLNAADYGDATSRKRLFILARRKGCGPIRWPEPSHLKPFNQSKQINLFEPVKPSWKTAREDVIDFSIPMGPETSIFNREAYGKKPLEPSTMRRIYYGLFKYGLKDFVIGQQSGAVARSLDMPIPAIATAGAIALVKSVELPSNIFSPYLVKLRGGDTATDINLPVPTLTAGGNHIYLAQPANPFLIQYHGGEGSERRVLSIDETLPTQDTSNRYGLIKADPFLVFSAHQGSDNRVRSIDSVMPTIAGNGEIGLALPSQPYIIKYYGNGGQLQSVDEPLGAVTTKERFALCLPLVRKFQPDALQEFLITDIYYRMLHWSELARAMSFPRSYIWLNAKLKPASNKDITKMIGNAWPNETGGRLCYEQLN